MTEVNVTDTCYCKSNKIQLSLLFNDRNEQTDDSKSIIQMNQLNQFVELELVAFQHNAKY